MSDDSAGTKYTPGLWAAALDDTPYWVQPPDSSQPVICDLVPRDADVFTEEDEANAHLIAAAPELLEIAIDAEDWFKNCCSADDLGARAMLKQLRAAIAKAEGR